MKKKTEKKYKDEYIGKNELYRKEFIKDRTNKKPASNPLLMY
jgi:hypothetical protein